MKIHEYIDSKEQSPVSKWLKKLDTKISMRIRARLRRIEITQNLGDYKKIKGHDDIYELRFMFGAGYRLYFAKEEDQIILLLIGGDKKTQTSDIKKAQEYWEDYNV